ncbi:MAG: acylphosphatase [Rickettsiales bacterium]
MSSLRVIIHGRVQGVGYRAWTVKTASGLGLKGWVRNRSEGTVEAVFHGGENVINNMIEACKDGPLMARVDRIESFAHDEQVNEERFTAKPTL